jgi:hypothetical protein
MICTIEGCVCYRDSISLQRAGLLGGDAVLGLLGAD